MSKRLWVSSALYWHGGPATAMLGGGTRWLSRTRPDNRKARRAAQAGAR